MKSTNMNEMVDDFIKVVQFKIITTIKNHYGSLANFKAEYSKGGNQALKRFQANFHIDNKILLRLTRDSKGKKHLHEVETLLKQSYSDQLVYKGKYDYRYKSGKKFSKLSVFYIPFATLDEIFKHENDERSPFRTDSGYYTARQHKLIDKLIFKYGKPRKAYTKSEKVLAYHERLRKNAADAKTAKEELDKTNYLKSIAAKGDNMTEEETLELIEGLI